MRKAFLFCKISLLKNNIGTQYVFIDFFYFFTRKKQNQSSDSSSSSFFCCFMLFFGGAITVISSAGYVLKLKDSPSENFTFTVPATAETSQTIPLFRQGCLASGAF